MIYLRYFLGLVLMLPFVPLMYFQSKRIKASVPKLPEAQGNEGGILLPKDDTPIQLVCIGESTIAGVGVKTHVEGFAGTLAEELANQVDRSMQWEVRAQSGFTAKQVRTVLLDKIRSKNPALIVFGIGANDAFELNTPWQWEKDVQALIEDTHERFPAAHIIFTNMPPIKSFPAFTRLIKFAIGNLVELLGESLGKLASNYDYVTYYGQRLDLNDWTNRLPGDAKAADFFSDGVHPSKLTYQMWAKDIAERIAKEDTLQTLFEIHTA